MRVPLIAPRRRSRLQRGRPDADHGGQQTVTRDHRHLPGDAEGGAFARVDCGIAGGDGAFGFVETNVPAFKDLYAGKLRAPRSRRHPRDLFDLKLFYDNEGLTD